EKIADDLRAVSGMKRHPTRHNQLRGGKVLGQRFWSERVRRRISTPAYKEHSRRHSCVGAEIGQVLSIGKHNRAPFDAIAGSDDFGRSTRQRHLPKMPAIRVTTIGVEQNRLPVRSERPLLNFASSGS